MKALSIKEPWLSLIVEGKKTIETRMWKGTHSGDLLLVGSKRPAGRFSGVAACIVFIQCIRPMTEADEAAACCELYEGAYSWVFTNVRKVKPFPIIERLGLYEVPDEIIRQNQIEF